MVKSNVIAQNGLLWRFVMNNMASIEENICKNVKYYRTQLQMTQKDVANILKITLSSYQKLEQGQRHFSTSQLFVLSQIFDVNIACLYDRENLDIKTNYKEQPSKILKMNIQKIFRCFGIDDFSIKDISALINLINRRGKGFLYITKIRADFWQYAYNQVNYSKFTLRSAEIDIKKKLREMERYYIDNMPGIQSEIAALIHQHQELLSYAQELEYDTNTKEQELKNLKQKIKDTELELRTIRDNHKKHLIEEENDLTAKIMQLKDKISTLYGTLNTLIPIEQYVYEPHTLDKDIFDKISTCIPLALQKEFEYIRFESEDLQYDLSVFEEYGFNIEDVSEESIDEFVNNKIQEYCKKEFHGWTWSKIRKATSVLFQYIKKYGLLEEYTEKDKNLPPRYKTPEEILNYYLKYH